MKQDIELKPGQLVGKAPSTDKIAYSEFQVNEENQKINLCSNGQEPQMSYFSKNSHTAKFKAEQCEG